jgi:8-oxo-dGTP diphosphatase
LKERNKAIPAVYIFLKKDGKYLLMRRYNTGYEDGNYHAPAGHVEAGELPTEAIIRETKEEINIDLTPSQLELVHVSYRPKHDQTADRVDFFFRARQWTGEVKNIEPNKCDDLKWVRIDDLPENTTPHVRNAMECMDKGIGFKELNIQWLKENGLYKL